MERVWRGEAEEPVEQRESIEAAEESGDFWDDILAGEAAAIEAGDDVFTFEDVEPEKARWWQGHADRWADPDYQRKVERIPSDHRPAPFMRELAERTLDWGTRGEKTSGTLDVGENAIDLVSGYNGPSKDLPSPRPGMHRITMAHVEAHTAAAMRLQGVAEATLYINRIPCPSQRRYRGCDESLPAMLPPGAKLTLYGPEGFCRVYTGLEDKQP